MIITQKLQTIDPFSTSQTMDVEPGKWNDFITLGSAVGAALLWLWRKTLRAVLLWLINGFKAPQRIEQLFASLDLLRAESTTALGMARAVWNTVPNPVWQSDALGNCVWVNRAYLGLLGYQEHEVLGLKWKQVIYWEDRARVFAEWESAVVERRPFDLPYRWQTKTGEIIEIHAHSDPIPGGSSGNTLCHVAFVEVLKHRPEPKTRKL